MDIDEDDDFYAPEEPEVAVPAPVTALDETLAEAKPETRNDELEEGEEEDESGEMDEDDDDSDVDIIVDRKDGSQPLPQAQSKYSEIRNIPQRSAGADETVKAAPKDAKRSAAPNPDTPASATSQVDINAIPVHKGTGKPITQVNIDEDLKEHEKPWRQPGTDLSDYFNYGFDEFTWALYAEKQEELRGKYNQDAIAQGQKKMMDDMLMMMGGGMMPGMPGAGANAAGGGQMPPMDGMPSEMQAMVQQMMMGGGGMDGQMDPSAMAAMFSGMQNGGGANGGQTGQGQNFQGGFGGAQGQAYGFDQQMAGGNAGGGNRGGFGGGRGRGNRRNW